MQKIMQAESISISWNPDSLLMLRKCFWLSSQINKKIKMKSAIKKIIIIIIITGAVIKINYSQTGWFIQAPFTSKNLYSMAPTAVHNLYIASDSGIIFSSTNNGYNWGVFYQDTALRKQPMRFLFGGNNDDFNTVGDSTAYINRSSTQVTAIRIVTGANQTKPNLRAYSYIQGCCQYQVDEVAGDSGIFFINDLQWRRDTAATRVAGGVRINCSSRFIFAGNNGLIMKADSIGLPHPNGERIVWHIIPSGTTQNLYGVNVTSSGLCMIVGAGGIILKSTNFGESWTTIPSPVQSDLYSIDFTYTNLICGANGTILRCTVNTYDNWFRQTTPTNLDLHSILSLTYTDYISTGNNGIILRTTDGGGPPAGITPLSNEIPSHFLLKQNYPNPFNPATNIDFNIPAESDVSLMIYDLTGRLVRILVNEKLSPGMYRVNFGAAELASGIYLYKLTAGGFTDMKKMILVK